MRERQYYRPEWTCGRFNEEKKVALYYNLIEGVSYFFDSFSAIVVGKIIKVKRNGVFSLEGLSLESNVSVESLEPFLVQLEQCGLVSSFPITKKGILDYRQQLANYKCSQFQKNVTIEEKLPMEHSHAEMLYAQVTGEITSVMFELTYRCSEACIHCYNIGATRNNEERSGRAKLIELTLDEYKRVIDELYEQGLVKVCLTGGDPFSKSIVWDIMDYLYSKNVVFDVYTNGQSIVNDIERLACYYPRTVGISLYSGVEKEHDFITRIKGSGDNTMTVIKRLSALAVPLNIKCCVMRSNLKTYHTIYDIARKYGAVAQMELNITDSIEGDCCARNLRLTPQQLEIVLRDDNMKLYVGKEAPNYGGQKRDMKVNACGAGETSYCLTPNGDFIPCCSFHLVFGNVRKQSIADIVTNSDKRKWWSSLILEDYEECGKHDYCDYCNLCVGNNFVEHGTPLKAGENNCYTAKIRHTLAVKMKGEDYDPLQGRSLLDCLKMLPEYEPSKLERTYLNNDIER